MLERLQKIIAGAGIASRRHAEELILSGQVRVNGVVVNKLGTKADPERDRIEAAGKIADVSKARAYLILHKPPEFVSRLLPIPKAGARCATSLSASPNASFPSAGWTIRPAAWSF